MVRLSEKRGGGEAIGLGESKAGGDRAVDGLYWSGVRVRMAVRPGW